MNKRAMLAGVILATCQMIAVGCQSAQTRPNDFGSHMAAYTKQGRYDDAVQVGIKALENKPTDEVIYQQIAIVYLIRAGKDEALREQWVSKSISYTEKALSLNSKDRDVAGVHVLQEALSFESAGDLSGAERCTYYQRAKKLLTDRIPLLQGEQLTIEAKAYPLGPLRSENGKILARIEEKTKAGCN
jgi:tetratricopeptide (TPR) repeat protein